MIVRRSILQADDGVATIEYELRVRPTPRWQATCEMYLNRFRAAFEAHAALEGTILRAHVATSDADRAELALDAVITATNQTCDASDEDASDPGRPMSD